MFTKKNVVNATLVACFIALFGASTAHAAESWTGPYLGVNGTYAIDGSFRASRDGSGQPDIRPTGPVGGAQIGYQYQFSNDVVVGAEADYQFASASGSGDSFIICPASVCGANVTERDSVSVKNVGTVRARLGYAIGKYLPYVTGGYAYGHATGSAEFSALLPPVTREVHATGWTAGAGLDYRLTDSWSARAEYAYLTLNEEDVHFKANVVRFGVNYHF